MIVAHLFADRRAAGRALSRELTRLVGQDPVVVALPRGGVPVGFEVASALQAPLDVLVVRKIGCPGEPELGIGAIGEGGVRLLNDELITALGVSPSEVEAVVRRETAELERRVHRYRRGREPTDVDGRLVIVVDDGLATGFTARSGIAVLRARGARRVVLAVPVGPTGTVAELRQVADEVVCPHVRDDFFGIGQNYGDFGQTTDEEVVDLLAAADRDREDPAPADWRADRDRKGRR